MIKLYGSGQSRSFRALWALEEAGLNFEYVEVTAQFIASDDYKALNSQSKIPTLVDGALVLTESAAIVNYVASLSDRSLMPEEGPARAEYDDFCYFIMTDFEQPLWTKGKHSFALRCNSVWVNASLPSVSSSAWQMYCLHKRSAGRSVLKWM